MKPIWNGAGLCNGVVVVELRALAGIEAGDEGGRRDERSLVAKDRMFVSSGRSLEDCDRASSVV